MDPQRLWLYLWEIDQQCDLALFAWRQLRNELERDSRQRAALAPVFGTVWHKSGTAEHFYADAMVTHAARLSLLMWPGRIRSKDAKAWADARGEGIRRELGDAFPLLQSRAVRNTIEHFDERLDRFARGEISDVVDRTHDTVLEVPPDSAVLRWLDIDTMTYRSLDGDLALRRLAGELFEIQEAASRWMWGEAELRSRGLGSNDPRLD